MPTSATGTPRRLLSTVRVATPDAKIHMDHSPVSVQPDTLTISADKFVSNLPPDVPKLLVLLDAIRYINGR